MDSSLKSETIEGYIDKNEWGSIFEITTNPDRYTQSEIGSDCINGVYEEQAPKLEDKNKIFSKLAIHPKSSKLVSKENLSKKCKQHDDTASVASFAKTDSDYNEEDELKWRNVQVKNDFEETMIFMEDLPVIGAVPIMFFLPECKMKQTYSDIIERYGGLVVEFIEWCVYQIYPEEETEYIEESRFFKGYVYSSKWLNDCIENKGTISPQTYIKHEITQSGQDINFSRTKFSIREVIKLFKAKSTHQERIKNPTYWNSMIDKHFSLVDLHIH